MGSSSSLPTVTFEDVQHAIANGGTYNLICTMVLSDNPCLIKGTIPIDKEESIINSLLNTSSKNSRYIIIYGKNSNDKSIVTRYTQLKSLGFPNVYIYLGGMFEWLLLQDIYGESLFPTTVKMLNILTYKPQPCVYTPK
jgi:hypothetical protein